MRNTIPNRQKCLELLGEYNTPERVKRHCLAVANVGVAIAKQLNCNGYTLNLEMIEAAGLLHDMLRVEENHGEKCAEVLNSLGYSELAKLIQGHMKYEFVKGHIDEMAIFCLGDRLVLEDKFVGIEKRMKYVIEKNRNIENIEKKIAVIEKQIKEYIEDIEKKGMMTNIETSINQQK